MNCSKLCVAAVFLFASACTTATTTEHSQIAPETVALFQERLEVILEQGAPGVSAYVGIGNKEWIGVAGVAVVEDGTPMSADMPIRMASITKAFTYAVVSELVKEGKLSREDVLVDLLPAEVLHGLPNTDRITISHLLDHRSGLQNFGDQEAYYDAIWADLEARRRLFTPMELLEFARDLPALYEPGTDSNYSNTNYFLLGLIIERVEEKLLHETYRERIIEPLGMSNTLFEGAENAPGDIVPSYTRPFEDDRLRWDLFHDGLERLPGDLVNFSSDAPEIFNAWAWASGAMASTPYDLSLFLRAAIAGEFTIQGNQAERFARERGLGWHGGSLGIAASAWWRSAEPMIVILFFNASIEGWDRMADFDNFQDFVIEQTEGMAN
jgi:D-alanyl-D-alanine carboxypeptidase